MAASHYHHHLKLALIIFSLFSVYDFLPPEPPPPPSEGGPKLWFARRKYSDSPCSGAHEHAGFLDACSYAKAQQECKSGGMIEYLPAFYCFTATGGAARRWIAYAVMSLWLAALFYMLGNTAADYFCSCLERLSLILRIPPTLAGVTLLPLGNGAPDVFASIVSFTGGGGGGRKSSGSLGLSSVLGGALFVVTVVAGLVNAVVSYSGEATGFTVTLNRRCFLRDGVFFLASLAGLGFILWRGVIGVWGAVAYLSIYFVYALTVAASEIWCASNADADADAYAPLGDGGDANDEESQQRSLDSVVTLPPWMWASQMAIYSHEGSIQLEGDKSEQEIPVRLTRRASLLKLGRKASHLLIEMPLDLPRQLTIPIISDGSQWSRGRAVAAATLAPPLLGLLVGGAGGAAVGLAAGAALGLAASILLPRGRSPGGMAEVAWIAGGFAMSVAWFYVIARELVAALVALASVLGVEQAALGATVLAWGNSTGDLVANTAMARGSAAGVQIAIAGCYGGPMFNTLFGLGVSLLAAALRSGPGGFRINGSEAGLVTVGFLMAGILAALVSMPCRGMRPSRKLGFGLMALYAGFLATRAWQSLLGGLD